MNNQDMLDIAMQQSAIDSHCKASDFLEKENKVVMSKNHPEARSYLDLPFYCNLVSYGNNIVASVHPDIKSTVESYINRYSIEHCFETPNMYILNQALASKGMGICFMAEYFLPDLSKLTLLTSPYILKVLQGPQDFEDLYTPEWHNALCAQRKELDVLGIGAYDGNKLIGLAACSADCKKMWQIGIDVLPDYRRCGIASALTSALALEIIKKDKVPFYCAAWSNIKSVRNAIKSGFRPAWVEMTAKSLSIIEKMNHL